MIPRLLKPEEKVISLPGLSTDPLFICVLILTKFQLAEVLTAGDLKKVLSKGEKTFFAVALSPCVHIKKEQNIIVK